MTELPENLIAEIGKTGYDVETWRLKKHLSSVKSISDIGIPDAKLHIYIGITSEDKLEIEIKPLSVFDIYNGLEPIKETQIIEEEDVNNISYIIKLINRMERSVFAKMLNQITAIQSKLNYILNYR